MGFSRYEYWSGLPCPPPGNLPDSGIEPRSLTSPALVGAGGSFTTSATWEAPNSLTMGWIQAPCIGSTESLSLDHQGSPWGEGLSNTGQWWATLNLIKMCGPIIGRLCPKWSKGHNENEKLWNHQVLVLYIYSYKATLRIHFPGLRNCGMDRVHENSRLWDTEGEEGVGWEQPTSPFR